MTQRVAMIVVAAMPLTALADWPQYMGPTSDGIAPAAEKIEKTFPEGGPKELWKLSLAGGFGSPAIVGDKAYILDRPGGGAKEVFSVIDLNSGKVDWTVENESQEFKDNFGTTRGTPTIDGTMAYAVGVTGDVLAIDLTEKKIAWKKNLVSDFGAKAGNWGFSTSPVILKDVLYVDASGSKTAGVVALDKKTGEKKWASDAFGTTERRSGARGADSYTTPIVVTINNVEQLVAWHKGTVAGVATADGKILWSYDWKTDRPIPNPVHLGDGRFFLTIGYGKGCAMIDVKANGDAFEVKEVFQDNRSASKVANAIFYKDHIYTNSSDQDQGLQCFDRDGKLKWQGTQKFGNGSMILVDGTILILNGHDGTLFSIEATPESYKELSRAKVLNPPDVWAPLALSNGKLLVRDKKTLKCLDVSVK
jgi:outer membrane protein assembly factor BamB